ncbi:MAG: RIP metalloprotease RseP [Arenicella sp.]
MLSFGYSIVGFLIAIAILVTVHEFGHYWVAKKLGVKVLKFSVGFGKPLWKKVAGKDNTEYVIAAIPLGGYVKMLGEGDDDFNEQESHRAFDNQALWKRFLIVLAGPMINFLFAILLYAGLQMLPVETVKPIFGDIPEESLLAKAGVEPGDRLVKLDGRNVDYFSQLQDLYIFNQIIRQDSLQLEVERDGGRFNVDVSLQDVSIRVINPGILSQHIGLRGVMPKATPVVGRLVPDFPAKLAGLNEGDKIRKIDSVAIDSWEDIVRLIRAAGESATTFTVERNKELMELVITPKMATVGEEKVPQIGIYPKVQDIPDEFLMTHQNSFFQAIGKAVEQTWLMSVVTLRMLGKMLTLEASPKNVSGPITIAQVTGDAIQVSFSYYINILALISISLGVMNLLPIPMLDGGHLLFYTLEAVAGKPLSEQWQLFGQKIGLVLLGSLMLLAFYNDIFRLLS